MKNADELLRNQTNLLEDQFFLKQDEKLIEKFRAMKKMKETTEALASVSGIKNEAVLRKLVELNIHPQTLASLAVVPLVEVAWADGKVDENEKKAILSAAERSGFGKDSVDYVLLQQWLTHKPDPKLLDAWVHYMEGLCELLSAEELSALRQELLGHTREVAEASGGFLGMGSKISKAERAILDRLERSFAPSK